MTTLNRANRELYRRGPDEAFEDIGTSATTDAVSSNSTQFPPKT